MKLSVHPSADIANAAAADCLAGWLTAPTTRTVMVAGGQHAHGALPAHR
jgi:hypothetical protein